MWTLLSCIVLGNAARRLWWIGGLIWLYLWFLDVTQHITSFGL